MVLLIKQSSCSGLGRRPSGTADAWLLVVLLIVTSFEGMDLRIMRPRCGLSVGSWFLSTSRGRLPKASAISPPVPDAIVGAASSPLWLQLLSLPLPPGGCLGCVSPALGVKGW